MTAELRADGMPAFSDFYRALHGRDPFPWQSRLAQLVAATDEWPSEVGVPTGLGKTACLDIAVWWLASQAHRAPAERTAPTRIWWVVNRHLLVDSTAEHAEWMRDALTDPNRVELSGSARQAMESVGERLRALSADENAPPLEVIRLRGGLASSTPTDPSRPAIILCTVPMYGSRLLFRGYGSTRRKRVVDAAMAGTDSLVLLDEAHLAPHLKSLLPAVADCTPGAAKILGPKRSTARMSSLTATGDAGPDPPFGLDAADHANPEVRRRLDAPKPLEVREATGDAAPHLAEAAHRLVGNAPFPAACIVFANTPRTARAAFARLEELTDDGTADLLLLTGLTREREAERLRKAILDPVDGMAAQRDPEQRRARHLIVVATQTLEVGADVDAEYLVTEACDVRALTQRLGRLNRLGRFPNARGVYLHVPPPKRRNTRSNAESWPVYGEEPNQVLARLKQSSAADEMVNMSTRRVAEVLGRPEEKPGRAPELLPGILWEWIKTTTPPEGEAPVEPYFSGIKEPQYSVSLIWRIHVPQPGERLWPRATDREAVDVSLLRVREMLRDETLCRLGSDGVTAEEVSGGNIRRGDRIVLPTDRGLLDRFGWNPESRDSVADVSLPGQGLPLSTAAIRRLCDTSDFAIEESVRTARGERENDEEEIAASEQEQAAHEILEAVRAAPLPPGWEEDEWIGFVGTLTPKIAVARMEVPRLRAEAPSKRWWSEEFDEFDETSLARTAVELEDHGRAVGARARDVADLLGLRDGLAEVVEKAGLLHDVGKADGRFQRWLDPKQTRSVPVAKSNADRHKWEKLRAKAGWPRGGRHEALSARLVQAWLNQNSEWADAARRDLLLHLIIAHHGKGRPLVKPVQDGTRMNVSAEIDGLRVEAPADLGQTDWDQPARFRRLNDRFGPWGLALLEAVVIRADHAVSAGADSPPETRT